jgi:hypothetical protein
MRAGKKRSGGFLEGSQLESGIVLPTTGQTPLSALNLAE